MTWGNDCMQMLTAVPKVTTKVVVIPRPPKPKTKVASLAQTPPKTLDFLSKTWKQTCFSTDSQCF